MAKEIFVNGVALIFHFQAAYCPMPSIDHFLRLRPCISIAYSHL